MVASDPLRRTPATATAGLLVIAIAKVVFHAVFHGRYGYFRDELYYIACSKHLAWGYVDQPPFSIAALALTRRLLGESLYAIRLPAALAGAATVVLTGLIARKLGGGRAAQLLSALAAALSPVYLGNAGRFFSMNAFDLLFWAAGAYVLVVILADGKQKMWLAYGVVAGLGVLNKYSMLFFGCGTLGGLLLTRRRRDLGRRWIWLGAAIAVVIMLPHLAWQIRNGFPSAEFIRNASLQKNAPLPIPEFLSEQVMMMGFGQTLLWLLGLGFFLFRRGPGHLRVFAWMFPIVAGIMIAGHSKAYYLTPIYFPLLAAGATAVEAWARRRGFAWSTSAVAGLIIVFSLISLPFAVPVLPVNAFIRYQSALGQKPKAQERSELADLPQYYADMFGWEELAAQIGATYQQLTPEEQAHCVIFARNYGQAGAIDLFGPRYGLPPATCPHNSYWFWGPGRDDMQVAILIGRIGTLEENLADLTGPGRFDTAQHVTTTDCGPCMPFENHRMIFLCRGPHFTFKAIWASEKEFL